MAFSKMLQRLRRISKNTDNAQPSPDAFIVSYPKCGRTWLRVLIGRYICVRYGLNSKDALNTLSLTTMAGIIPTHFTHDGTGMRPGQPWRPEIIEKTKYQDKRVLLLLRDPREVMVSCYFEATKRTMTYSGTLSEFIRDPYHGVHAYMAFIRKWEECCELPQEMFTLHYSDLHAETVLSLKNVLEFIGCSQISDEAVREAVEYGSFENMRKLEASNYFGSKRLAPGDINDPESFKVRRGEVGGFRTYLSASDCDFIEQVMADNPCGFLDSYAVLQHL